MSTDILESASFEESTRYYNQIGASRFVVSRIFGGEPERELTRWIEKSGIQMANRFENDSFTVYETR